MKKNQRELAERKQRISLIEKKLREGTHFFVKPTYDIAFRKLFGKEAPDSIAISLLNTLLELPEDQKVTEIVKLDTYSSGEFADEPFTVQDFLCKDQNNQQYLVELQIAKKNYFEERMLFYFAKNYRAQIKGKVDYSALKKLYCIAIIGFDIFPELTTFKHNATIRLEENNQRIMHHFDTTFIELTKFTKSVDECKTAFDHWLLFLKQNDYLEKLPDNLHDDDIIEAYNLIDSYNWDEEEQKVSDKIQTFEADKLNAEQTKQMMLQEAKKKGGIEAKLEIAKSLLEAEMNIEQVAKITGLSIEEIKQIK